MKKAALPVLALVVLAVVGYTVAWPIYQDHVAFQQAESDYGAGQLESATAPLLKLSTTDGQYKADARQLLQKVLADKRAENDGVAMALSAEPKVWFVKPLSGALNKYLDTIIASNGVKHSTAVALYYSVPEGSQDAERRSAVIMPRLLLSLKENPQQPWYAVHYAQWFEAQAENSDKLAELIVILEPVEAKLLEHADAPSDLREGARILGQQLYASGKIERAFKLLQPYVVEGLKRLEQAAKQYDSAFDVAWQAEISKLNSGQGPKDFYDAYDAAEGNDTKQNQIVNEYVYPRLEKSLVYTRVRDDYIEVQSIVNVAIDFAILRIQRAQSLAGKERIQELEAAEKVFLAINAEAGNSDTYRMYLGQVYYWLGKHEQGKALFEELLVAHSRSHDVLYNLSHTVRSLGDDEYARQLLEEAYEKGENDQQRYAAAHTRSILSNSETEQLEWLDKADPESVDIRAGAADIRARQAARKGDFELAKTQYLAAIAFREKMAEGSAKYNNTALNYESLYDITGEINYLTKASELMVKALELEPSQTTILYNAATQLQTVALSQYLGGKLDYKVIKSRPSFADLGWFYLKEQEYAEQTEFFKANDDLAKAEEYLRRLLVLSPQRRDVYGSLEQILFETGRESEITALIEQAKLAPRNIEQDVRLTKESLNEETKQSLLDQYADSIAADETQLKQIQANSLEYDYVWHRLLTKKIGLADYVNKQADKAVLAEVQALVAARPVRAVERLQESALCHFAHHELVQGSERYKTFVGGTVKVLSVCRLIRAALVSADKQLIEEVTANESVQGLVELAKQRVAFRPSFGGISLWAWLRHSGTDLEQLKAQVGKGFMRESSQLDRVLYPVNLAILLNTVGFDLMDGKPDAAAQVIAEYEKFGLPFPALQLK